MSKLIVVAAALGSLALTGCTGPDYDTICSSALQGYYASDLETQMRACQNDVWHAQHTAGYNAAKKYRELPR